MVDESKLHLLKRRESSRIEQDCNSTKTSISLAGLDFFNTDEQRHNLITALQGLTFDGYQRLLSCMSFLIEQTALRKNKSKHRRQARADYKHTVNQPPRPSPPVLQVTEVTGLRRSTRISHRSQRSGRIISHQPQRRSARIEKQQKKTNRAYCKSKSPC